MNTIKIQTVEELFRQSQATDDAGARAELLLGAADILLDLAIPKDGEVSALAEADELIDLAIGFKTITKRCEGFYDSALPQLEEELSFFQEGIARARAKVARIETTLDVHQQAKQELLAREAELRERGKELDTLEQTVAELEKLCKRLYPERLAELERRAAVALDAAVEAGAERLEQARPHCAADQACLAGAVAAPLEDGDLDGTIHELQGLAASLNADLERFDQGLQRVLQARETALARIRGLNRTG